MKALYDLKDKLCMELDEIAGKPDLSAGDLETVHKLTDTIKNIDKIAMLESDGGYSRAGGWEARGEEAFPNNLIGFAHLPFSQEEFLSCIDAAHRALSLTLRVT